MAADFQVRVLGLPELRAALMALPIKLRQRALRNALAAGARLVRNDARQRAPVLEQPLRRKGRIVRKPGTVRDAISVRTSKVARRKGDVGVFINVRPAKGGKRGAASPDDPYYWRFINWGTKKGVPARRFLDQSAGVLPRALDAFKANIGPQIARMNVKGGTK